MSQEPKQFQRRIILIKKSLQVKYIALVFLSVLAGLFMIGLDVYYTVTNILVHEVDPSLYPVFARFNQMILVKVLIYLFIMLLVSLFVSHRIAGPIYRFEKSAEVVGRGDLTHRVCLRRGDELGELEELFNRMVSNLQLLVQKDKHLSQQIASQLEQTAKDSVASPVSEQLLALSRELEHVGSGFKV